MSMRIECDAAILSELAALHRGGQALFADGSDQTFGEDDDAVMQLLHLALDDRADDDVAKLIEGDVPAGKFLGNDGERGRRCLADAQRQMSRGPAHADDQVPARGGAGVLEKTADNLGALLSCRLEAKGRR